MYVPKYRPSSKYSRQYSRHQNQLTRCKHQSVCHRCLYHTALKLCMYDLYNVLLFTENLQHRHMNNKINSFLKEAVIWCTNSAFGWKRCQCVTWGFRREVADICALQGCYAAYSDNSLPTLRDDLSGPLCKGQEIQEQDKKCLWRWPDVGTCYGLIEERISHYMPSQV